MEEKKKILIPQAVAEKGRQFLLEQGYELVEGVEDEQSLYEKIQDCQAVLLRTMPLGKKFLQHAPKLQIVARHGAGFDNVDWQEAEKLGIYVTNTPFVTSVPVAEFTLALILTVTKRLDSCNRALVGGDFWYKDNQKGTQLFSKTLGIFGLGNIGMEVAKRAYYGFGMGILAYEPYGKDKDIPDYIHCVSKKELLEEADIVTLHIPGGEQNRGFISGKELKLMKESAYLINAARGGIVDEKALIEAVEQGEIAGAAVDVFETEPPATGNPILHSPGIFVTPHMASNTVECMEQMALTAAEEIHRVLSGQAPLYGVNCPKKFPGTKEVDDR